MDIKKLQFVNNVLLRRETDLFPLFISATPQFMDLCAAKYHNKRDIKFIWDYCVKLDLDIIQIGHPSFYPTHFELPIGSHYLDDFGRNHVISKYYDDFCAPFPLQESRGANIEQITKKWKTYKFPNPRDSKWLLDLDKIVEWNKQIDNPLCIWGVINGPFEPTWQLLSDGWPDFFLLAKKNKQLALDIISRTTEYCIAAGQEMIRRGVHAIRIGDDYGHNQGLLCKPSDWLELIYPYHKKLVQGLKKVGGKEFPVILHSDGDITEIFNYLAEGGMDALNPIQPDALDFKTVVNQIGHKLSMTGAFDLRHFLKPNTPETKKILLAETRRLMSAVDEFNKKQPNGEKTGFCIGPSHQIQAESNVETFESWIEIVHNENNIRRANK
jgi:uroporphyrinogen-III decarboxylase